MKKGISIVIALALIGIGGYVYLTKEKSVTNYPGQGRTVVAFGDSLISGIGASKEKDFVSLLSQKTFTKIINEGVPGETTRAALKRVPDLLHHDPKLVILLLGGNDALQKIPREETFRNLSTIIQHIHNSGSMVLLLGVQGGVLRDPYKSEFKHLAETHQVAYVDNVVSGIFAHSEFMSDSIHPNDAGYAKIADRLYPILIELLQ